MRWSEQGLNLFLRSGSGKKLEKSLVENRQNINDRLEKEEERELMIIMRIFKKEPIICYTDKRQIKRQRHKLTKIQIYANTSIFVMCWEIKWKDGRSVAAINPFRQTTVEHQVRTGGGEKVKKAVANQEKETQPVTQEEKKTKQHKH